MQATFYTNSVAEMSRHFNNEHGKRPINRREEFWRQPQSFVDGFFPRNFYLRPSFVYAQSDSKPALGKVTQQFLQNMRKTHQIGGRHPSLNIDFPIVREGRLQWDKHELPEYKAVHSAMIFFKLLAEGEPVTTARHFPHSTCYNPLNSFLDLFNHFDNHTLFCYVIFNFSKRLHVSNEGNGRCVVISTQLMRTQAMAHYGLNATVSL